MKNPTLKFNIKLNDAINIETIISKYIRENQKDNKAIYDILKRYQRQLTIQIGTLNLTYL